MLAGKPVIPAKLRYPLHCKDCNASVNGKADWDKSCCNSCANYEPEADMIQAEYLCQQEREQAEAEEEARQQAEAEAQQGEEEGWFY